MNNSIDYPIEELATSRDWPSYEKLAKKYLSAKLTNMHEIRKQIFLYYSPNNTNKDLRYLIKLFSDSLGKTYVYASQYIYKNFILPKLTDTFLEHRMKHLIKYAILNLIQEGDSRDIIELVKFLRDEELFNFLDDDICDYVLITSNKKLVRLALRDINPEFVYSNGYAWIEGAIMGGRFSITKVLIKEIIRKSETKKQINEKLLKYIIQAQKSGFVEIAEMLENYLYLPNKVDYTEVTDFIRLCTESDEDVRFGFLSIIS